MSTMQPPPPPSHVSPIAVNTIIASLVAVAGVVLVIISGGFVMVASYIMRSALILPPLHENRDMVPLYMALAIVPSICAIITFIFGLRIVSKGLGRLMQQGTSLSAGASRQVI